MRPDVAIVGTAQAGHRRVLDHARNRLHRLEIAVRRGREARLDHIHAHAFQLPRNAQLLLLGHRGTGALLAVAHGGVEYDQSFFHVLLRIECLRSSRGACLRRDRVLPNWVWDYVRARRSSRPARGRLPRVRLRAMVRKCMRGNIAGFSGYCNWAGRRFFHTQYAYPDSPYATKSRNSTIGGSEMTRINPRTMSRITANGTERRRLMSLKLWKGTLLTIVIPA